MVSEFDVGTGNASESGRTEVSADYGDGGSLRLRVVRDGLTVHSFDLPREPESDPQNPTFKAKLHKAPGLMAHNTRGGA